MSQFHVHPDVFIHTPCQSGISVKGHMTLSSNLFYSVSCLSHQKGCFQLLNQDRKTDVKLINTHKGEEDSIIRRFGYIHREGRGGGELGEWLATPPLLESLSLE